MPLKQWEIFEKEIYKSELEDLITNNYFLLTMFATCYTEEKLDFIKTILLEKDIENIIEEKLNWPNYDCINHLYNYLMYAKNFSTPKNIIEFGAGYGRLCVTINKILRPGYLNSYKIYDLPKMQKIQAKYLDYYNIKPTFINELKSEDAMFIATWSLSEADEELMNHVMNLEFSNYLIAYGDFEGRSNDDYFIKFKERRKNVQWMHFQHPLINGSKFLFGSKIDD